MMLERPLLERPDGARLAVEIHGEGPPLLLLSGLGGTAGFWRGLLPELAARHRVAIFDQRGVGASTRGTAPVTIQTLAEDAAAVAALLGEGPVALVGHSTGAAMVMTMQAQRMLPVSRLVLSAGWLRADHYLRALFTMRLAILQRAGYAAYEMVGRFLAYPPVELAAGPDLGAPDPLPPEREAEETRRWAERIQALLAFDGTALAPRVSAPTLVLGTPDDVIVPYHHQKETAAAVPGAVMVTIDGGGHFYPLTRRDAFLGKLLPFLT